MPSDLLKEFPQLEKLPKEKLEFIQRFADIKKPTNRKEFMPFILSYLASAKNENMHFSKEEVQIISSILSKNLPKDEQEKIKKIMNYL